MATPPHRSSKIETLEDFIEVHSILLAASGIPSSLYRKLFEKLSSEIFDGGNYFSIEPCEEEEGRQRRLVLSANRMEKESDLFLVDHAWTFRLQDALKLLKDVPGLVQRMTSLMCVDIDLESDAIEGVTDTNGKRKDNMELVLEKMQLNANKLIEKGNGAVWLELEELGINDDMLCSLGISDAYPNLVALNLWGNKLHCKEKVVQEVTKCTKLKALWLNDNPVVSKCGDELRLAILSKLPRLEIYNSQFTSDFSEWALGFCGGIVGQENPEYHSSHSLKNIKTLDLSNRYILNFPVAFSPATLPSLSDLNLRGNPLGEIPVQDILEFLSGFPNLNALEVDIPGPLGNSAIKILEHLPRVHLLNGVSRSNIVKQGKHIIDSALRPRFPEWKPDEPLAERVIGAMWLYLMTYRLADEEKIDETSVWYVMDELGSALRHSDEPNFRLAPFLFMPEGKLASAVSFSVLWPTKDVINGEECTRDFLFGIGEDKQRSARLTAWFHTPENYFIEEFKLYSQLLNSVIPLRPTVETSVTRSILPSDRHVLQVYTDNPQVEENLSRPEFVLTNDPKSADIIWTSMQVDSEARKSVGLRDDQYINQFPFEACLVMKHHLAETIHKAQGSPDWLQPTYNLETQLSPLIGEYFLRKKEDRNNLWILKPWNMARTIDTTVTDDISSIIRLMETGPKICQKYIEHPALFKGRKFDIRYIVLVRSMNPVEICLADIFWVRLANNPYTLEKRSLFEYETHFTVMNYIGRLSHMNTADFVREFEEEHQVKWSHIHEETRKMIRSVFDSAAAVHPEMHSSFSRSMYGVDVMLDDKFMPKLLEVTYCPDCDRACKYDSEVVSGNGRLVKGKGFFNFVFGCLFLGEQTNATPI